MSVDHAALHTTARERLLAYLLDLQWHAASDLGVVAGNRYAARLLELRRLGYAIETRPATGDGKSYRLTSRTRGPMLGKKVKIFLEESDAAALLDGVVTMPATASITDALASFRANRAKL